MPLTHPFPYTTLSHPSFTHTSHTCRYDPSFSHPHTAATYSTCPRGRTSNVSQHKRQTTPLVTFCPSPHTRQKVIVLHFDIFVSGSFFFPSQYYDSIKPSFFSQLFHSHSPPPKKVSYCFNDMLRDRHRSRLGGDCSFTRVWNHGTNGGG